MIRFRDVLDYIEATTFIAPIGWVIDCNIHGRSEGEGWKPPSGCPKCAALVKLGEKPQ